VRVDQVHIGDTQDQLSLQYDPVIEEIVDEIQKRRVGFSVTCEHLDCVDRLELGLARLGAHGRPGVRRPDIQVRRDTKLYGGQGPVISIRQPRLASRIPRVLACAFQAFDRRDETRNAAWSTACASAPMDFCRRVRSDIFDSEDSARRASLCATPAASPTCRRRIFLASR